MPLFAKDIVEKDFVSLPGTTDALTAARAMRDRRHGFAVVVAPDGTPQGIVTEWDYLERIVAAGRDPATVRIEDLMTKELVSVDAGDGIDKVAEIMAVRGVRRVLVTKDGRVLGVVTAKTILARMRDYIDDVSSLIARAQAPPF